MVIHNIRKSLIFFILFLFSHNYTMEQKEYGPFATGGTLTIGTLILKHYKRNNIVARVPEYNKLYESGQYTSISNNLLEGLFSACDDEPKVIRLISVNGETRNAEYFINPENGAIEASNTILDENDNIVQLDPRVEKILSAASVPAITNPEFLDSAPQPTPKSVPHAPKPRRKSVTLSLTDLNKAAYPSLHKILNENALSFFGIFHKCEIGIINVKDSNDSLDIAYELKTDLQSWGWNQTTAGKIEIKKNELSKLGWKE